MNGINRSDLDHLFFVGISGLIGAGKDEAATVLKVEYGFKKIALADRLKEIAYEEFGWDGKKDEKGRRLLQVLGTECGRHYNKNIWIEKLAERALQIAALEWSHLPPHAKKTKKRFVVPDVRFPNEKEWIEKHGICIRVERPSLTAEGKAFDHASEQSLSAEDFDYVLYNDATLFEFHEKMRRFAQDVIRPRV